MAWGVYKVEQQRLEAMLAYSSGLFSMTDVCKKYNISRKTAYKWYKRYLQIGEEGLKDISRAPLAPNFLYPEEQIQTTINLKLQHKTWGPKKFYLYWNKNILKKSGHLLPVYTKFLKNIILLLPEELKEEFLLRHL